MATDSTQVSLDEYPRIAVRERKPLVRYNPEFNSGNILQIVVLLFGFAATGWGFAASQERYRVELAHLQRDVEVNKLAVAREVDSNRAEVRKSLDDINSNVRDISIKLNDVNTNVAVLKAQSISHK